MSNYAVMQNEIAYPTIEPDVDDDAEGGDYDPEDHKVGWIGQVTGERPITRTVTLTPQGHRECLLGILERLSRA